MSLRQADAPPKNLTCTSIEQWPAGEQVQALVLAHQKAIEQLAITVASTARQWSQEASIPCPSASRVGSTEI
jgi:hypothetical protein